MFIIIVIIIVVIGSLAISSAMLSSRISREEERKVIAWKEKEEPYKKGENTMNINTNEKKSHTKKEKTL